ncbi:MAG: hypothetical protein E7576_12985 [Ruminococcaceae bacterium]|jgi:hypothetical protein|nr:hypothetical protein [Oscillospiraceae bacterium]
MSSVFNILDFGAVPDGVTDSTAAIQNALDAAGECMGEVVVPPGIYCTGRLTMRPQTKLSGTSAWLFGGYGGSIFRLNTADTDCMIDITGAFGVQISGMNLEGCRLGENIHGVKLFWPVYNGGGKEDTPTIDDCKIGHFTGDGVRLEHIWCFSIRHSMLCFNGGAGLYVDGWDGFILDNWFSANQKGGMLGGPVACSVTTTGNRVEWNRVGGFVLPSGNTMNITGNYFDRSGGPALKLGCEKSGMESLTITGNLIYRSGKPGPGLETEEENSHVLMQNCVNVTFTGNTMRHGRDDNGQGTWSPDICMVIRDCDYCVFANNAIHRGSMKETIRWDGRGTCRFEGNLGEPVGAPDFI